MSKRNNYLDNSARCNKLSKISRFLKIGNYITFFIEKIIKIEKYQNITVKL